jgi:hypothetical protein
LVLLSQILPVFIFICPNFIISKLVQKFYLSRSNKKWDAPFNEYIRERITKLDQGQVLDARWIRLKEANHLLRYINQHCDTDEKIHSTFTPSSLKSIINQIKDGVELNNELAEKAGFFDALDAYYSELIGGIKIDYLLDKHELSILQELGSLDPEVEMAGIAYLLKHRGNKSLENALKPLNGDFPASKAVSNCMKAVPKEFAAVVPLNNQPRRWFKCAGKIVRGAGMSIGNIAFSATVNAAAPGVIIPIELAGGVVGLGLVSVLAGTAEVLEGVGELRGE